MRLLLLGLMFGFLSLVLVWQGLQAMTDKHFVGTCLLWLWDIVILRCLGRLAQAECFKLQLITFGYFIILMVILQKHKTP